MTGGSVSREIHEAELEEVAREAWEAQARNISSPPLKFDDWWEARRLEWEADAQ